MHERDLENVFDELCRYVRFSDQDREMLHSVAPYIVPHAYAIADEFYARLEQHEQALRVFSGPEQMRLQHQTLTVWIRECFEGPWNQDYYERRARIGRVHVRIDLPQRYMFGGMNVMRQAFIELARRAPIADDDVTRAIAAINKLLDLELAIMLETYREAFMARVQAAEREHQKSLERLLALAQARYGRIVEQGEALVVTFDAHGRIILFNAACERMTGIKRDDAVDRNVLDIFFADSHRDEVRALWQAAMSGRQGAQIADDLVVGGIRHYVRWQFTRLPSDDEPLLCALGMDITEARIMSERANRAEQLASLGTMAAGLAHEIRNPLNAAHLHLTLVKRRLAKLGSTDVSAIEDAARIVADELQRLATLVSDFLQFAHPKPPHFAVCDLASTVRDVLDLVSPEATEAGVPLRAHLPQTLVASFDSEYVKQVVHNLVRNAVEACEHEGQVDVELGDDGSTATLSVRDNGKGLLADTSRLFEPFFTTKSAGTGLGLAIVHRVVTGHGGTIDVDRKNGETVFSVRLPLRR